MKKKFKGCEYLCKAHTNILSMQFSSVSVFLTIRLLYLTWQNHLDHREHAVWWESGWHSPLAGSPWHSAPLPRCEELWPTCNPDTIACWTGRCPPLWQWDWMVPDMFLCTDRQVFLLTVLATCWKLKVKFSFHVMWTGNTLVPKQTATERAKLHSQHQEEDGRKMR